MNDQLVAIVAFLRALMPVINTVFIATLAAASSNNVAVPAWVLVVAAGVNSLAIYGGPPHAQRRHAMKKAAVGLAADKADAKVDQAIATGMKENQ